MADEDEPDRTKRIAKALAHPLVLLAFGALLTGVLVPRLASDWQRREAERTRAEQRQDAILARQREELSFKTKIVSRVLEATSAEIPALTLIALNDKDAKHAFDDVERWDLQTQL